MPPLPDHTPDVTKFTTFVRNVMGISANLLPDDTPVIQHSFDYSLDTALTDFAGAVAQRTSWSPYELAIYNLAGHMLIEYAPDVSYGIVALSWAAGLVSGETAITHAIMPGDQVKIIGVSPLAYAGPPQVGYLVVTDVPDDTHFGYRITPNPGTAVLLASAAVQETFFSNARKALKINSFAPGVVASTGDLSTSVGLNNPDFMKGLTLENLQLLKTPYGRRYLEIAQKYGPNIWGLTR